MFVNFNILNQLGSPAINSNTFANRPAAGQTGRLFVSTDTFEIYRDNGTTWDLIGGPGTSTITGTGTATQVAYFTSSQAIGSSANLFWDNTSGFLGVGTAAPTTRIEAVKTDGVGIYANFTTNAGSGSSTTGIYSKNTTNSSGYAAVIEESTPNTTAGQYPLLIKHSLSSGTAGVGMGTGLQFQLPDDAGAFKTTQLTIETIDAAAATYKTRYRFNVQNNGSSTPVAYINATGLGIFTATPGAALDIHSTGVIAQFNTTSGTGNTYVSFQRTGTGVWRIGDTYNSGANFFGLFNNSISTNAIAVLAATNKTEFTAVENYTTGLARGNYFDYNLNVPAGGSFSSPNAITALGASLDLTLAGNATIPSGARSGLDAYNSIAFTGAGTLTHNQGTQIRAYSNVTAGWAFNGSAVGTITHLAGLRALFPDNTGSAVNVTNNYALLLNDQTANTGTVTYTNRWGVYQEGASDLNYMAANLLLGSTTNNGNKLQVTGNGNLTGTLTLGNTGVTNAIINSNDGMYFNIDADSSGGSPEFMWGKQRSGAGAGGTTFMTITNAGLVGIGTSTPTTTLMVASASGPNFQLQRTGFSGFTYIEDDGTNSIYRSLGATIFQTNGANERVRLTSAGLFGIGTSTPGDLLTVFGTGGVNPNALIRVEGTSNYAAFFANNSSGSAYFGMDNSTGTGFGNGNYSRVIYCSSAYPLDFYTNSVIRTRLTSGGNFLIGTTTDAGQKLQVNGTSYLNGNTTVNTSSAKGALNVNGSIGLSNGSIRTYAATGDITITITGLTTLDGNSWRQAGGTILYQGVRTNLSDSTTLFCVFTLQGLSTWNSVTVTNLVGTTTLTLSNDTTTGCTLTLDVVNTVLGSALVQLTDTNLGNLS